MDKYWIIIKDLQKGPYTLEQLKEMSLSPQTPVWREGLVYWTRAYDVDELAPWTLKEGDILSDDAVGSYQEAAVNQASATVSEHPSSESQARVVYVHEDELPAGYVALPADGKPKCPRNYLALSIISTLLFFLPLGICAIFCSAKVEPHYQAGRYDKAYKMSERAQLFIVLSIVCMLIWLPFSVVVSMI